MTIREKTVILIPARSGSTRVEGKNIRALNGKPLVGHIIETALAAQCGRVIVSTDSEEIAGIARDHGAETPFLRPAELSTATSSTVAALLHALRWLRDHDGALPDTVSLCPPTNAFTRAETIAGTCRLLRDNPAFNSVITICRPDNHPFSFVQMNADGLLRIDPIQIDGKNANNVERSQDLPQFWLRSGNCSTTRTSFFVEEFGAALDENASAHIHAFDVDKCLGYEISPDEAHDIDTPEDFMRVENELSRRLEVCP